MAASERSRVASQGAPSYRILALQGRGLVPAARMRIGVIGLGAIGGVIAAKLLRSRRPDETIALAAGSERAVEAIRRGGLRIRGEPPIPPPELLGANLSPAAAPYDAILVAAAAPRVPEALKTQLADGGRLAIPIGPQGHQELTVVQRRGAEFVETRREGCIFVPLVGEEGWPG